MTDAIIAGLLAGLGTIAVSEWFLQRWAARLRLPAISVSLIGTAVRSTWILGWLIAGLWLQFVDPKPFVLALLGCYFVGLMFEARRYQAFFTQQ